MANLKIDGKEYGFRYKKFRFAGRVYTAEQITKDPDGHADVLQALLATEGQQVLAEPKALAEEEKQRAKLEKQRNPTDERVK